MFKIDVSKIEGYENMTAEQKIAALEGYEIDSTGWVKKDVLDKATSDAADWKKKYQSTLSEAEQAKIASDEAQTALNNRLAELERKDKISTTKDQYIASGFSTELAQATAEAFVDGHMEIVLANITKYATEVAKAAKDKDLKNTPAPPASGDSRSMNIDYSAKQNEALEKGDFAMAAYYERMKAEQNNK